jgi:lysophospholipase L1-like esterase
MLNRYPILARSVLSGLMAFAVFGGIEILAGGSQWSALYSGDPGSFWVLRPGIDLPNVPHLEAGTSFSVKTNPQGFRDGLIPVGTPWVLALGCSTTFGWGVEGGEAWPEILEGLLGVPVFNAGVPGHSTEQGKRIAEPLFSKGPAVAILAWGLRDGQRTLVPDVERRPAIFPRNTATFRWLSRAMRAPVVNKGHLPRVSEARMEQNLREIIATAERAGVKVLLLDMTERSESPNHGGVLERLNRPLVVPRMADSMYFEQDPIHLTVDGNRTLARLLEPAVNGLLGPESELKLSGAERPQTP